MAYPPISNCHPQGWGIGQLASIHHDWNGGQQWAADTLFKTIGQNLGQAWAHDTIIDLQIDPQGQTHLTDSGQSIWTDLDSDLSHAAWQSGLNRLAQAGSDHLVQQLGINATWSTVAEGLLDYGLNVGLQTGVSAVTGIDFQAGHLVAGSQKISKKAEEGIVFLPTSSCPRAFEQTRLAA